MPSEQPTDRILHRDRLYLRAILVVAFLVGLRGIVHLGYIGQDFESHNTVITTYPDGYGYHLTNPPGLYWLGNFILRHLSGIHYLEILAGFLLVINLAGLWLLFGVIWRMIDSRPLRYTATAFIAFVPFRAIHSVVISSDAFTIPFFALAVVLTLRLFDQPKRIFAWIGLSLTLALALTCKYTFIGTLGAAAAVLAIRIVRELTGGERLRWMAVALFAFALPAAVFQFQMHENRKVDGYSTSGQWKVKGTPSRMRWRDILTLQKSDIGIFSAPQYFRDQVYEDRKYSYMALVHLTSFTDSQNFFERPPAEISAHWKQRVQKSFFRERSPGSQRLARWAVAWCVPFSILAIAGTLFLGVLAVQALFFPQRALVPPATIVVAALATGFYAPVLISLPQLGDPYTPGFWLPRLVLPGLLMFFVLGFALLDFANRRNLLPTKFGKIAGRLGVAHAAVTCALFAAMLA